MQKHSVKCATAAQKTVVRHIFKGRFNVFLAHLAFAKHRPIRNKNCLWRPWLLMERDKMSNLYRGPSIDASYQVSLHLAEGFQSRRLKCEKLTDNRRWTMDAKILVSDCPIFKNLLL
jgi:hypothetical protein